MSDTRRQPFALASSGRSGSTYLYDLLARHPQVGLTNEGKVADFLLIAAHFAGIPAYHMDEETQMQGMIAKDCNTLFVECFEERARDVLDAFYVRHFPDRALTHWGDKMISCQWPLRLMRWMPDMKWVILARDPRDVVCSMRAALKTPGGKATHEGHLESDAATLAQRWAETYDKLHRVEQQHPDACQATKYEDLLQDGAGVTERIQTFLGLTPDPAVAAGLRENKTFQGHGTSKSPEASVARWRRDLTADEVQTVERICASSMAWLGYEPA